LFEITGTCPDEGYVQIKEVFTGDEIKIIYIGLSGGSRQDIYIYTRIITYQGVSFSSGLNFIFGKDDEFIEAHIKKHMKDYSPMGEFVRFTQLYNRFSKDSGGVRMRFNSLR